MLEWTLASAIGLVISAAGLLMFIQQLQLLKAMLTRHRQEQDIQAVLQVMRAELRIAGQRDHAGPSRDHDVLSRESGPSQSLHYLCDRCGSPDRTRQSSFRLQDGLLAHRNLGVAAHQGLHDHKLWALRTWQVEEGQTGACSPWVRVELASTGLGPETPAAITLTVRPRNLGALSCEREPRP